MRKGLKIIIFLICIIAILILLYLSYLWFTYKRLPEQSDLQPTNITEKVIKTKTDYSIVSYNIGYGSYPPSYSFFMDGGSSSIAYSPEAVKKV